MEERDAVCMNRLNGTSHDTVPALPPDSTVYDIDTPEPLGRGIYRLTLRYPAQHRGEDDQVIIHDLKLSSHLERLAFAKAMYPNPDDWYFPEFAIQLDQLAARHCITPKQSIPPLSGWDEMLDQPPVEWLIDGLLPAGVMASLTGKWGTGKSFLAAAWACSIATGRDWLNFRTKAGAAVYVAAEGYKSERLEAYALRWPLDGMTPRLWFRRTKLALAQPQEVADFIHQVRDLPNQPRLIVLDTLARCSVGLKENDASDMAMVVDGAAKLIEATGATVLFLHHPPHDSVGGSQERGRGSSAIDAACDTTLILTKGSAGLQLKVTKQKDGELPDPLDLTLTKVGASLVIERQTYGNGADFMSDEVRTLLRILSAVQSAPNSTDLRALLKVDGKMGTDRAVEAIAKAKSMSYIESAVGKAKAWQVSERGRIALMSSR